MKRKMFSAITLTLLLTSMLTLAFNIQPVKAEPRTWIVDDDGPADFHTIQEAINNANAEDTVFVRNGTYYENVIVNKTLSLFGESKGTTIIDGSGMGTVTKVTADNVTIMGLTIRNSGTEWTDSGIALSRVKNCNVSGNNITANNGHGIYLYTSSNNSISGNNITANSWGGIWVSTSSNNNSITGNNITANRGNAIWLDSSNYNSVAGNNIANNKDGLVFCGPSNNRIVGNNIANNGDGIRLFFSSNNTIFHNNFVENQQQFYIFKSYGNLWDNDYPSGGNYWSDYVGVDVKRGSNQDLPGSDGIGDTSYIIDADNRDHYPLMNPYHPLSVSISPLSASIFLGQSVTFTSTVSGGYTPYSYQWYLNGAPVSGATSASWTFTPTTSGIYYIHLKVTDAKGNTTQSDTARITVATVPVGGYSFPIQVQTKTEPIIPYIALIATLTAILTKLRPKTKRKR